MVSHQQDKVSAIFTAVMKVFQQNIPNNALDIVL